MFRRNAALVLLFVLLISPSTTFAQQASTSPTPATAGYGRFTAITSDSAKDPNDPIERIKDEGMKPFAGGCKR